MNKLAYIFPGQGAQYVGMGKTFYDEYLIAQEVFEIAFRVLGFDLKEKCFEGPMSELIDPLTAQASLLAVSYIAYKVFEEEEGIVPDYVMGHSFGELSALVCSGAIGLEDGFRIVKLKGDLISEHKGSSGGLMLAVNGVELGVIESACYDVSRDGLICEVGIINSTKQVVVSGNNECIEKLISIFENIGGSTEKVRTKAPYHSKLLLDLVEQVFDGLDDIKFQMPKIKVFSTFSVNEYKTVEEIRRCVGEGLVNKVDFVAAVRELKKRGVGKIVEIGPRKVLSHFVSDIDNEVDVFGFCLKADLKNFQKLRGSFFDFIGECLRVSVCLKNNSNNNERYQAEFVGIYGEVKKKYFLLKDGDAEAETGDVVKAYAMLNAAFRVKEVDDEERVERINELFSKKDFSGICNYVGGNKE